MFIGRSFELADGTIVTPCEFCQCPVFEASPLEPTDRPVIDGYDVLDLEYSVRIILELLTRQCTHMCPGLFEAMKQRARELDAETERWILEGD